MHRMNSKNIGKDFLGINKVSYTQKCQIVHIFLCASDISKKHLTDFNMFHTLNLVKT